MHTSKDIPTQTVFLLMLFVETKNNDDHLQELKPKGLHAAWNSTHKFMSLSS